MTAEEKRLRALLAETVEMLGQFPSRVWCPPTDDKGPFAVDVLPLYCKIVKALERSDASKRGKSNRSKGHESELMVVAWLRDNGFPDAVTTRNTGGEGGRQVGDVSFAPGAVLEVKYEQTARYPAWCRQAALEAGVGRVPIVVRRVKGAPDVGQWPCVVPSGWYNANVIGGLEMLVGKLRGDFAAELQPSTAGDRFVAAMDDTYAVTRFWRVAEAFRLDR